MSDTRHPEVLWAQRSSEIDASKNIIYLTVNLPDLKEDTVKYELTSNKLSFKGTSTSQGTPQDYAFELELFGEVLPEESAKRLTSRHFVAVLRKKDIKLEYWPRLTKEKLRIQWLRTDFEKWADEDEQDVKAELDTDGMEGMGGMGGLGGMGGMGGMDMEKLMSQIGGAGGASALDPSSLGGAPDDSDEDEDGPPPLESVTDTAK